MTFYNHAIALDATGQPKVFEPGVRGVLRSPNCQQTDGMTCTVKKVFDQIAVTPGAKEGPAVLLEELSWCFCSDLEI